MTHAQVRFLNLIETPAKPEKFRLVKEQTSIANTPMHRHPRSMPNRIDPHSSSDVVATMDSNCSSTSDCHCLKYFATDSFSTILLR